VGGMGLASCWALRVCDEIWACLGPASTFAAPSSRRAAFFPVTRQVAVAYSCVVLWITLSAGVILFNKYLLSAYGFPYPVALTLMHMGFCSGTLPLNCTAPPGCEGPC
jgi:hypothetical protein